MDADMGDALDKRWDKAQRDDRIEKLVGMLAADKPVCDALREAGFPEAAARKGWRRVPKKALALLMQRHGIKQEKIGHALMQDPNALEARIVGAMHDNMIMGRSKGVNAAKVLIQHKSVASAFVHESANNVVVIQAPADWKPKPAIEWDDKPALPPSEADFPEYE